MKKIKLSDLDIIDFQDLIYAAYDASNKSINLVNRTNTINEDLQKEITDANQDAIIQLEAICEKFQELTGEDFELWDWAKG